MKIELHILQSFAPSNLNRDDTGSPKDCEFGGYRRARISSQCIKRAIREAYGPTNTLQPDERAARTKRLAEKVADELSTRHGRNRGEALRAAKAVIEAAGLKFEKQDEGDELKSQYLLFIPARLVGQFADLVASHWDALEAARAEPAAEKKDEAKGKKEKSKKADKAKADESVSKELSTAAAKMLSDVRKAPELALFGRMIADNPEWNADAACQVAHAISTHRVSMEFDFFTAVDDLRPVDTAGSDMMGTVTFNASCFYRYSVLDVESLAKTLGVAPNDDLVRRTLDGFVRASIHAIPTGKQNTFGAQNPPSYVLAVVRDGQSVSLANAFLKPVRPTDNGDVVDASISALESYFGRMQRMLGTDVKAALRCDDREGSDSKTTAPIERLDSLPSLTQRLLATVGAAG